MQSLINALLAMVGPGHVLTHERHMRRYCQGYRFGLGQALAVVRPGHLLQLWRVLEACVAARAVIVAQAANTGLTGGSTPVGADYDGPVIVINTLRMQRIDWLKDEAQVLCQPGVTLDALERFLQPHGREPHSVIGSSCIGATVVGGVCNNSGGALIRRGPAFTQLALYARINAAGQLELVNDLGLDLGQTPLDILQSLDRGQLAPAPHNALSQGKTAWASDREYAEFIRDIHADTPARFNEDPRRLYGVSGSAGKVMVFAVRLDTFVKERQTAVFYIGTNDADELQSLRREILSQHSSLPIAAEYLHRNAYDLARDYGKDIFLFVRHFGTQRIPRAFAAKSWFDGLTEKLGLGGHISDHLLQALVRLWPQHLPARMQAWRERYAHHLILKTGELGWAEMQAYLAQRFPTSTGDYFACSAAEGDAAFLHRFAVGGAVVRYRDVHAKTVEDIVALDIALPRNTQQWLETLPQEILQDLETVMYCGHFFCQVMHQEYLVKKGRDCAAIKKKILALLDQRGARYPAEHNVGHQYQAAKPLVDFYRQLDPTNSFNPGLGKTSKKRFWA